MIQIQSQNNKIKRHEYAGHELGKNTNNKVDDEVRNEVFCEVFYTKQDMELVWHKAWNQLTRKLFDSSWRR